MKKLFSNKRLTIAIVAIVIVVVFVIFQWARALWAEKEVLALCEASHEPCGSRLSLYFLPSIQIFLFSTIVFFSAFLLLSAVKHKD